MALAASQFNAQHLTVRGLNGDPRRPSEAKRFERPAHNPDAQPPDGILLLSLFLGIVGVLMKSKSASWMSLFTCLSSVASMSFETADFKQIVSAVTFAIMGLVASYLGPTTLDDRDG